MTRPKTRCLVGLFGFGLVLISTFSFAQKEPERAQLAAVDESPALGSFLGFGIGIHPGDIIYEEAFDELNLEFVRMELGPLWYDLEEKIPSDGSVEELYTFIKRNYNGDAHDRLDGAIHTHDFLRERGTKIVLVHFELPYHWRVDEDSGLIAELYIDDLARFYTAHLLFLKDNGVTIDYIELANEPDGHWNGHLPPDSYVALLQECDALFENNGLGEVQILGPGLAFLNLYNRLPAYMQALSNGGYKSIDGWSAHTWDEVEFLSSQPEYSYGVWQPFLDGIQAIDPKREKPLFVTEYGADVTQYSDRSYASPRDQKTNNLVDSWDYAVRVMANSISHMNRGANALILYRLSNAHWHKTGWGIIQPESPTQFRKKPVYNAVKEFLSELPTGKTILSPTWYSSEDSIIFSLFRDETNGALTLIAVNWTETSLERDLPLSHDYQVDLSASIGLQEDGRFSMKKLLQLEPNSLRLRMPKRSIARIELIRE